MVIKTKFNVGSRLFHGRGTKSSANLRRDPSLYQPTALLRNLIRDNKDKEAASGRPARRAPNVAAPAPQQLIHTSRLLSVTVPSDSAEDVIDLGAPRPPRRAHSVAHKKHAKQYTPNPRLYPGPTTKPKKTKRVHKPPNPSGRCRRRCPPVPNSRLYRPAARVPRASPPPARPRASWPLPAPPASQLETASTAALRLAARPQPPRSNKARRLVVTLPAALDSRRPQHPRPSPPSLPSHLAHPLQPPLIPMEGATHSTSPEEGSDGNDTQSAPSEFLAEFLSAIMQRQYAEALKYCRLILRYEPHNATARGFYPLLRHKLGQGTGQDNWQPSEGAGAIGDSGEPGGGTSSDEPSHSEPVHREELMEQDADEYSSAEEGSSLSLDSCASSASPASPAASLSASPDHSLSNTDPTNSGSCASGAWAASSCSEPDDNGNALPRHDDVENDNAAAASGEPHHINHLKSESSSASLRRLRAQFACSIK